MQLCVGQPSQPRQPAGVQPSTQQGALLLPSECEPGEVQLTEHEVDEQPPSALGVRSQQVLEPPAQGDADQGWSSQWDEAPALPLPVNRMVVQGYMVGRQQQQQAVDLQLVPWPALQQQRWCVLGTN